ncbi:MAG: PQQ-dependent sugar dehydrogenase [Actinomycetota bacterium]
MLASPRSIARRRPLLLALALSCLPALGLLPGVANAKIVAKRVVAPGVVTEPVGFTFAPNGRLFVTSKSGSKVFIVDRQRETRRVFASFTNVSSAGERGVLGVALHPDYPATRYVYVYVVRRSTQDGPLQDQIVRLTDVGGKGRHLMKIWHVPVATRTNHNGGRIAFGPDDKLYAVVGDLGDDPARSQDLADDRGKVLRMEDDGSAPVDNPFAGSRVFSYGLRNSFGFGWDPRTGNLWETENGPACNDELNLIQAGGNYAWGPSQTCAGADPDNTNQDGPDRILPVRWFTPTIAATGLTFCDRCALGERSRGTFFFGASKNEQLRRARLNPARDDIVDLDTVVSGLRVISVETAPSGAIFFSTFDQGIYKLVRKG